MTENARRQRRPEAVAIHAFALPLASRPEVRQHDQHQQSRDDMRVRPAQRSLHRLPQIHAIHEFHEAEIVDGHDARMIEPSECFGFVRESLGKLRIGHPLGREKFQRDQPAQRLLPRLIDRAHPAATEELNDFQLRKVRRDFLRRGSWLRLDFRGSGDRCISGKIQSAQPPAEKVPETVCATYARQREPPLLKTGLPPPFPRSEDRPLAHSKQLSAHPQRSCFLPRSNRTAHAPRRPLAARPTRDPAPWRENF